ncbi:MAG TPA: hydrogenase [Elusimicrobia bacterium]|nr:MAG: hydrogenase [Elusimicrobia bacterium GWD2_63_28]HCC47094.1 hydrogenase [Elusimicrobiota bacterium]
MEIVKTLFQFLAAALLAPLLPGVINRVKAFFAGRRGQPLGQLYYDLFKLLLKTPVYSRTTTWVFKAGPIIGVASLVTALALLPFAGRPSFFAFEGDFIFLIYLLGLARFATVLAALDTGSAFEGMGASREMQFAVFAEPAFFLGLAALARVTGQPSLAGMFGALTGDTWRTAAPVLALLTASFFIVLLAENSRVPADDPNTHLELTMIHEAMVLDHSGPDLAFILYGASLKLWLFGALICSTVLPRHTGSWASDSALFLLMMFGVAAGVGIVESVIARLRLTKVPFMLITAFAFSALALIFQMGR